MSRHYQKKPFHTNFEFSLTLPWRTCGRAFMAFNISAELTELQRTAMLYSRTFVYTALVRRQFSLYNETNSASRLHCTRAL